MPAKAKCDSGLKYYKTCEACCEKKSSAGKYSKKECAVHCPNHVPSAKRYTEFLKNNIKIMGSRDAVVQKYREEFPKKEKRPPGPFAMFVKAESSLHKPEIDALMTSDNLKRGVAIMKVMSKHFSADKKAEYTKKYNDIVEPLKAEKASLKGPKRDPSPFAMYMKDNKGTGVNLQDLSKSWLAKKEEYTAQYRLAHPEKEKVAAVKKLPPPKKKFNFGNWKTTKSPMSPTYVEEI